MLYSVLKTLKIATAIIKLPNQFISNFTQSIFNQEIITENNFKIIQLITNINKPKVIIKKGNQINLRMGLTM